MGRVTMVSNYTYNFSNQLETTGAMTLSASEEFVEVDLLLGSF
ncbi:MAG: hypothetical protein ACTS85_04415 [Arsenophonus sp. NC-PG7-MAG3]